MSIWNKYEEKHTIKELDKDINVDILIIGGCMTGLNTAYFLKDKNICVVDANKIGYAVTLNTTAKINYFQDIYSKIKKNKKEYLESQISSMNTLVEIINKENIDCDLLRVKSYLFSKKNNETKKLEKEISFFKENNINVKEDMIPNVNSLKSYSVDDTYIFNPLKYLNGLYNILTKNNVNIYENTKVLKIEKHDSYLLVYTNKHKIKAKQIIIACHYPNFLYPLFLPLKSTIEKSYIVVSKVNEDLNYTCINLDNPIYSVRYYKDKNNSYQISLSESHNISFSQNDKKHFKKVRKMFNIKEKDIVMEYSNVDIITPDYLPYIGKISDNIYIGCGYNTWGMTNSILASTIIKDLVLGKHNKYESIFNPKRFTLDNLLKFPLITFGQIKSYIGPKLIKNKGWYKSNLEFRGNLAIYKDKNGFKHTIINKCPHLGCSLIFNEKELSWDCPCHSSRFDIDGNCIKGPSNYDISYKNK